MEVGSDTHVSETQHTILDVSRVPTREAGCPIWLGVRILKAAKLSEHLGLSNAWRLFLHFPRMVPSHKSVEPQFLVTTCMVPTSEGRILERFSAQPMLDLSGLLVRRGCPKPQKALFFGNLNRSL